MGNDKKRYWMEQELPINCRCVMIPIDPEVVKAAQVALGAPYGRVSGRLVYYDGSIQRPAVDVLRPKGVI